MSSILRSIQISLPWPPPQVFPNYRYSHGFRRSAPFVKVQKELGFVLTKEQIGRKVIEGRDRPGKWPVHLDIYPPNRIRRDEDGMVGACKAALDGIALALKVDDSLFAITHTVHAPEKPGRVVVTVTGPGEA